MLTVLARDKARLTRGLEAGIEGAKARVDVLLGESKERCLCGLIGGFKVLGDMVEGLANPGIVAHDDSRYVRRRLRGAREVSRVNLLPLCMNNVCDHSPVVEV